MNEKNNSNVTTILIFLNVWENRKWCFGFNKTMRTYIEYTNINGFIFDVCHYVIR